MIRRAACLGRGAVGRNKWPQAALPARCLNLNLNHCISTSLSAPNNIPSRTIAGELPSLSLVNTAFFSSAVVPKVEVKESQNDGAPDHAHYTNVAQYVNSESESITSPKAERRKKRRRILIAEEMMRIFATNDECFNITLRELDVDKTWGTDSGLYEYRQFYLDSLKSFGTILAEDQDDENALAEVGLSTTDAQGILEQFVDGFIVRDVSQSSKKYRKMTTMLQKEAILQSKLKRLRRDHKERLKELKVEESLLESLESEQAAEKEKYISSLGNKVVSAKNLLSSLNTSDDDNYSDELDRIERELTSALSALSQVKGGGQQGSKTEGKDLIKQRKHVDQMKMTASNLASGASSVESEIDGLEWAMPRHEFESITENIVRVATSVAPALAKFITHRHDDFDKYKQLEQQTDLTKPWTWYPRARLDKRKIIFHAGPTNSGKTYNALQRLKQAERGMYLAPLRLLAAEIYESLTSEGIYTDLLTGQEHREVPFSTHRSSTVELACIDTDWDVVVIDEIQMLSDEFRGFAWTRALLGVRCQEIHVCGGAEAIDIVKKICLMSGDDFELHNYERFSNLKVLDNSLAKSPTSKGSYSSVQPGDCVVAFSRHDIFAIKREIENSTKYKCCVVYGSLPPNVRAEQARNFNDPNSEYEILVATDAIGMGLNLSIKRIIFNSMFKSNGEKIVQLDHSSVKQIAGRAGRRNSPYPNGEVTCRDPNDMAHLKKCMATGIQPLQKAGLVPTPGHIGMFTTHLEELSGKEVELSSTLRKFSEMATMKGDFFLCRKTSMEAISRWLKDIDNNILSPVEKFTLCMSPVNESCAVSKKTLMRYVETYASGKVPGLHRSTRPKPAKSFNHLADLCKVFNQIEIFIWLQNKLPSNAVEVLRAVALKERTIEMINNGLLEAEHLSLNHDYISKDVNVKKAWANEKNI